MAANNNAVNKGRDSTGGYWKDSSYTHPLKPRAVLFALTNTSCLLEP